MTPTVPRRPYCKPVLVVYGRVEELTLTDAPIGGKNDMFGNLKTV